MTCAMKRMSTVFRDRRPVIRWVVFRIFIALIGVAAVCFSPVAPSHAASGWTAAPIAQANGDKIQTPLNVPVSRRSGLTLSVDTRWSNSYGYRPVEVTISSPQPAAADRRINVRLHSSWTGTVHVEQAIVLPQGSTSVTTTISVPQYQSSGQSIWWDVWVDGVKDQDLSLDIVDAARAVGGGYGSARGLSILMVGPNERTLTAPNTYQFDVLQLPLAKFPRRWIDYTALDVVLLSRNEVQAFAGSNASAFTALERWVRAGGHLWVSEVGNEFQHLDEMSKLLNLRDSMDPTVRKESVEPADGDADKAREQPAWQPVRFREGVREGQVVAFLNLATGETHMERVPDEVARLQRDPNYVVTNQGFETAEENSGRRWPANSSEWFVEQRMGTGVVRAYREPTDVSRLFSANKVVDPNAVDESGEVRMPRALATAVHSTQSWQNRHGTAPDEANRDFVNLLVPGVGTAPVTEFRVLITIFVLLIGPVNYWLLKRWRRLHLMVLTVPLTAALMTTALFAYATLSDGFGTTVRVRSFATIDQRTGEAACWSRISYYSGVAPGSGLILPADVAIYPVIPAWNASGSNTDVTVERELQWDGNQARLTRGWLRSRTPTQYLMIRSRKSPHRIELAATSDKLRATNELGADISLLLVFDEAAKTWMGENLVDKSRVFLKPTEQNQAVQRFRQIVVEHSPEPPMALSSGDSHYAMMQGRQARRRFGSRYGSRVGDARLETNVVNEMLADLAGLSGKPALALPPRSYVAVTTTGPEVEIGLRGATEEASFHLVLGQW